MDSGKVIQETNMTSYMFSKACDRKIPLSGTFELSPVCNLSCRMCYVRKTVQEVRNSPRPIMTLEGWISLAEQLKSQGMLYLLLTGGEPFLWPDFWELYEKLSEMGFLISINSNATLIDEGVIEKLKKRPPVRINITLYGTKDATYEALCGAKGMFTKVDRAITELRKAGITVKLNCSLTPINAGDLEEIVQYGQEKELILEIATYMFPPVRRDASCIGVNERFTPEEATEYNLKRYQLQYGEVAYRLYLERLFSGTVPPPGLEESCIDPTDGQIRCRAGKASFWITWDGWLTSCGMMLEPKVDLYQYSFSEAWKQLTKSCEILMLSGVCSRCKNRNICHVCAAMAAAETGSVSGIPVYLCREVEAARKIAEKELLKNKLVNKFSPKSKKGGK